MKTVTVRITLVIDSDGNYAVGSQNIATAEDPPQDEISSEEFYQMCEYKGVPRAVVVTAEVPIPEPVEVEGRVEK